MMFVTVLRTFHASIDLELPEGSAQRREHDYLVEARVEGDVPDERGFLMDITLLEAALGALLHPWNGRLLNDMPEFTTMNPTLETVARVVALQLAGSLPRERLTALQVTLWESEKQPYPGPSAGFRVAFTER